METAEKPSKPDHRAIIKVVGGMATSDGDGVKLTRLIGSPQMKSIDPFLLLDRFGTDEPSDYIGGFPSHPHRGFQTVTYMLDGRMRHKDNAGHEGVIESGGVQWMSAGRGVIHSEMPEQTEGRMSGFQLWVNLPAEQKMSEPKYQEFPASKIPTEILANGASVTVLAGVTEEGTRGPVQMTSGTPIFLDAHLPASTSFDQSVPETFNGFIYVIEGEIKEGDQTVLADQLGVFGEGDRVHLTSGDHHARFLLVAGKTINEPIAWGGPFVMNTQEEVAQAFEDYQSGRF